MTTSDEFDAEMAAFLQMEGPTRAIESEHWFRKEIIKALAPIVARVVQLESKPMPAATPLKPSKQWEQDFLRTIGTFVADKLKERDARIATLESKMANWKYCGVWSAGNTYEVGNFVTHHGSLFTCLWSTQGEPATVDAWQLCCQRGKNGKDASRQPTMQRSYAASVEHRVNES